MSTQSTKEKPGTVRGSELHEGSVLVDVKGCGHVICRLVEYPGRFVGDHARVAYFADGGEATVADHLTYHCASSAS